MKWNLRLTAANRGIWKASELQRMLAERGLVISAGKMSGLWSGDPTTVRLSDLDVICAALGCTPNDLLLPEPEKVRQPGNGERGEDRKVAGHEGGAERSPRLRPRTGGGRSLPPS